ncbi:uncharacterized protein TNCV_4013831 [Trichonephila clavipes]|nr:uncharacterized protein TNCV_4013831 [Trichonephila clavipes]
MAFGDSLPQINLGVQVGTLGRYEGGNLLDHVISRLELQILDYVEGRHPQATSNLLQIIDKSTRNRQENWRETRGNYRYSDNSRPQREFNRSEGQGVGDNRRFDSRSRSGQSDHRFHNQDGRQDGSRNGAFRGQNGQTRYLNFSAIDASLGVIDRKVQKILPIRNTVKLGYPHCE